MNYEESTLFSEDPPANPSPAKVNVSVRPTKDGSGRICSESLWKHDLDGYLLKTFQDFAQKERMPFSLTWRKRHTPARHLWLELVQSELRMSEEESGLLPSQWPTPRAGNPGSRPNMKGGKILAEEVKKSMRKLWPTPTTQEVEHPDMELTANNRRRTKDGKDSHSIGLADSVKLNHLKLEGQSTPASSETTTQDGLQDVICPNTNGSPQGSTSRQRKAKFCVNTFRSALKDYCDGKSTQLPEPLIDGQLSPAWISQLMGWPTKYFVLLEEAVTKYWATHGSGESQTPSSDGSSNKKDQEKNDENRNPNS